MAIDREITLTTSQGSNIMLAGIIFQLGQPSLPLASPHTMSTHGGPPLPTVSLTVFSVLMAEYFFRYSRRSPVRHIAVSPSADTVFDFHPSAAHTLSPEMGLLAAGLALESFLLMIRYAVPHAPSSSTSSFSFLFLLFLNIC